jgi:hypothetical protein
VRVSAATIVGEASGLPGDDDGEVGNWLERPGVASLLVEGAIVLRMLRRLADR